MKDKLPAKVQRTGMRQLSVTLGEAQAKELERMRLDSGLRSWGQVIRMLIADAMSARVAPTPRLAKQPCHGPHKWEPWERDGANHLRKCRRCPSEESK